MSRRSLTLAIAGLATVAAIAVTVLVPVPYVILGAGPTLNTLGKDSTGTSRSSRSPDTRRIRRLGT